MTDSDAFLILGCALILSILPPWGRLCAGILAIVIAVDLG